MPVYFTEVKLDLIRCIRTKILIEIHVRAKNYSKSEILVNGELFVRIEVFSKNCLFSSFSFRLIAFATYFSSSQGNQYKGFFIVLIRINLAKQQ